MKAIDVPIICAIVVIVVFLVVVVLIAFIFAIDSYVAVTSLRNDYKEGIEEGYIDDDSKSFMGEPCIFSDTFKKQDVVDRFRWQIESNYFGGGNHEFQAYIVNAKIFDVDQAIGLKLRAFRSSSLMPGVWGTDMYGNYLWSLQYGVPSDGSTVIPESSSLFTGFPGNECTNNGFNLGMHGCYLKNKSEIENFSYVSGRMRTHQSFGFLYGRVEVEAKIPKGDWAWPAAWMTPTFNDYGNWPMSPEVDILESYGNNPVLGPPYPPEGAEPWFGNSGFGSTLHWGSNYATNKWMYTRGSYVSVNDPLKLISSYNIFGLYWDSTQLYTYIREPGSSIITKVLNLPYGEMNMWDYIASTPNRLDPITGELLPPLDPSENPWNGISTGSGAPFNVPMSIIVNLAVGGFGFSPQGTYPPSVFDKNPGYFSAYANTPNSTTVPTDVALSPYYVRDTLDQTYVQFIENAREFDSNWSSFYAPSYWPGKDGYNTDGTLDIYHPMPPNYPSFNVKSVRVFANKDTKVYYLKNTSKDQ